MSYTCETCGQVLQSEGSFGLHKLSAHPAPPPPAPPPGAQWATPTPPPSAPPYAQYPGGPYVPAPGRTSPVLKVLGVIGLVIALLFVGSLAAVFFLGSQVKDSAQVRTVDPAKPPALPPGYTHMIKADEGFLIGVPASFQEMSLSGEDVADVAGMYDETNPDLADIMRNRSQQIQQAKLFAIDQVTGSNENVMRIIVGGPTSVDDVPPGEFSSEYEAVGATGVSEERVTLPAGGAIKVTATISAGPTDFRITQHVLVRDSQVWMLTYTEDASVFTDTADTIASTFAYTR